MKGSKPAGLSEPLGVSPKEASRLTSICLTNIYEMLGRGELDSKLVNGRRIISYASLKKRVAPDQVRQVRHDGPKYRRKETARQVRPRPESGRKDAQTA